MIVKNKAYIILGILFIILCLASFLSLYNIWVVIPGLLCGILLLAFGIQFKKSEEIADEQLKILAHNKKAQDE